MITFNFNDLKTVTDKMPGKKGVWYVGVKIHDGHRYPEKIPRQLSNLGPNN